MSLTKIASDLYYFAGPTNCGIFTVKTDNKIDIYIIDTGGSKAYGSLILKAIDKEFNNINYQIKAIINTHSHADHTGGNSFIKENTDCEIWISKEEAGSILNPFLQPFVTWGGAPIPELNSDYYNAPESRATRFIQAKETVNFNNSSIEFISLEGHYFGQLGVLITSSDDKKVLFAGDSIFGHEHIMKYWIPFLIDPEKFKESLDMLENLNVDLFVPSHGEPFNLIEETCEMNKIAILSTEFSIKHVLSKCDLTLENIVYEVCKENDINMRINQFILLTSTIRSYLTSLEKKGFVKYYVKENRMFWHLEKMN